MVWRNHRIQEERPDFKDGNFSHAKGFNRDLNNGRKKEMKGWLTLQRLLIGATGLVMAGLLLAAPPAVDAAERSVRFNIPGCMS